MTRVFDTSRLRWILAGAVAVLALAAAAQALATYRAYDLTVGVLSVVALAVTMLVGLGSLAVARRRIGLELTALREPSPGPVAPQPPEAAGVAGADPASSTGSDPGAGSSPAPAPVATTAAESVPTVSTLYRARRERLLAIRAAGVRPDRPVLAEATAAEEAGRAYIGRYFVATTVLIGLVGTFAGLMATLSKVAPILHDQDAGGLALLAGPLSGLHVTFGASLVAILATLALALAQGDLALHEEQALAVLEDRTTHQLIPSLWPPAEEPAERTLRAFAELKTILAEAVAQSLEQSAARMSKTARSDAERAARALESTAAAVEKQITELGATVGNALQAAVTTVEKQLGATTSAVEKQLSATAGALEKQLTELGATVGGALETSSAAVEKHMTQLGTTLSAALEASGARVEKQVTQLSTSAASVLETSSAAVEKQLTKLASSVGGALETATQKQSVALAESARKQAAAMAEAAEATTGRALGAAEEAVRRSANLAEEAVRATTAELGRTLQPMLAAESQRLELVREAFGQTVAGVQEATGRLAELQAVLEGNSRAHAAAIENAGQAVLAAFDRAVLGAGASLDAAAVKLATAAHDLGGGVETFSPAIATLATELGALGRELALQAARGPEGDLGAVVLSELDRIGAGLDRLVQLSRLAGGGAAFPSPTAAELGAAPTAESRGPDTEETHS